MRVVVAAVEDSDDPSEVLRGEALVVERVRHVPGGGEGQDGRLHPALHRLGWTVQVQAEKEMKDSNGSNQFICKLSKAKEG